MRGHWRVTIWNPMRNILTHVTSLIIAHKLEALLVVAVTGCISSLGLILSNRTSLTILLLTMVIIALLVLTLVQRIKMSGRSKTHFLDEEACIPHLARHIRNAKESIYVTGPACTCVLKLEEDYYDAMVRGVQISVFVMDPDDPRFAEDEMHIEEGELLDLLDRLSVEDPKLTECLHPISLLPKALRETKLPILLSLVYGWQTLASRVELDESVRGGIQVYVHSSSRWIKAMLIDKALCVVGHFNREPELSGFHSIGVFREDGQVESIRRLFDTLLHAEPTKAVRLEDFTHYQEELDKLINNQRENSTEAGRVYTRRGASEKKHSALRRLAEHVLRQHRVRGRGERLRYRRNDHGPPRRRTADAKRLGLLSRLHLW
jgi:hypothetical protein